SVCLVFFFFFQAEDGIRDSSVTGVQTCALPIFQSAPPPFRQMAKAVSLSLLSLQAIRVESRGPIAPVRKVGGARAGGCAAAVARSEERRVGKECRSRGERDDWKKGERVSGQWLW